MAYSPGGAAAQESIDDAFARWRNPPPPSDNIIMIFVDICREIREQKRRKFVLSVATRRSSTLIRRRSAFLRRRLFNIPVVCLRVQRALPKLPVPDLRETLDKYLQCVRPTVSADQYEQTCRLVAEFVKKDGLGEYLQRKLFEYAETKDNWVRNIVAQNVRNHRFHGHNYSFMRVFV